MLIKAGTTLVFETDDYSDRTFHGPFFVLREFDQADAAKQYEAQWRSQDQWDVDPDAMGFIAWLASERYVEEVRPVVKWHIGSYYFDPTIREEPITVLPLP